MTVRIPQDPALRARLQERERALRSAGEAREAEAQAERNLRIATLNALARETDQRSALLRLLDEIQAEEVSKIVATTDPAEAWRCQGALRTVERIRKVLAPVQPPVQSTQP